MNKKKKWGLAGFLPPLCLLAVPVQASTAGSAKKAYKKFLSQSKIKWSDMYFARDAFRFALVDINGDKVPELYVENWSAYGYQGQCALYAYVKGKVKEVYHFGNCQAMECYYPSKGVFVDSGGRMGYYPTYFVKFKADGKTSTAITKMKAEEIVNGKLKTRTTYYSGSGYNGGKKISKSKL